LESEYARLRTEINETFRSALPQETSIVDPLAQLEQKLQLLEKDYALFGSLAGAVAGPLEVLNAITASTPEDMNISLDDMLITAESVRLAGTTKSFDSVYKWQRLLEKSPQFSAVEVGDTNATDGERVSFVVLASFAAGGRE